MYDYRDMIVITDRILVEGDFLAQLEKVSRLRPQAMILREKDLDDIQYEELAGEVKEICGREGIPLFVNSRTETARRLGIRNLHLPVAVLSQENFRRKDFDRISAACHSLEDVRTAAEHGATQIILGTIFETDCKKGLKGKGLDFLREICAHSPLPVYAIGGITMEKMKKVREAGAAGGCMMSGFMKM